MKFGAAPQFANPDAESMQVSTMLERVERSPSEMRFPAPMGPVIDANAFANMTPIYDFDQ